MYWHYLWPSFASFTLWHLKLNQLKLWCFLIYSYVISECLKGMWCTRLWCCGCACMWSMNLNDCSGVQSKNKFFWVKLLFLPNVCSACKAMEWTHMVIEVATFCAWLVFLIHITLFDYTHCTHWFPKWWQLLKLKSTNTHLDTDESTA